MPYKNPDDRRNYQRARRKTRPGRDSVSPVAIPLPLDFKLKTAKDAIERLEEQARAVAQDTEATTLEKARVIGYLVGVSLKAIEAGDIAQRLEELEAKIAGRRAAG